ncbi:hypothetical protein KFK09_014960 [Dendrobium nobile]|uniref:Uncharacterized protein n=1 Tax=Dendrobium nobile TaxID=94219 RepID=A0A8T3B5V0_DENNO|nr:hypothetical protein KFK09_014960 [Dendrobium nobile]
MLFSFILLYVPILLDFVVFFLFAFEAFLVVFNCLLIGEVWRGSSLLKFKVDCQP